MGYDVILDASGKYAFLKLKYALKKKGRMVSTIPGPTNIPPFNWVARLTGKRLETVMCWSKRKDLELIGEWMTSGKIHSVPIDSIHDVKDIQDARERQEDPKKLGRVVIKVEGGW